MTKRTTASRRLRRRAAGYKRLAWRRDLSLAQARSYLAMAERLDRQADREEQR